MGRRRNRCVLFLAIRSHRSPLPHSRRLPFLFSFAFPPMAAWLLYAEYVHCIMHTRDAGGRMGGGVCLCVVDEEKSTTATKQAVTGEHVLAPTLFSLVPVARSGKAAVFFFLLFSPHLGWSRCPGG